MSRYRGPAGVFLTEDEWHVIYLILLTQNTDTAVSIRGRIRDYLILRDHPGVRHDDD